MTSTTAVTLPEAPSASSQSSMYLVNAVVGRTTSLPFTALAPLQPPEALQDAALGASQMSVDDSPVPMVAGFALNVIGVMPVVVAVVVVLVVP